MRDRVLTSHKSTIMYYCTTVSSTKCCIYNNLVNDFNRYIITRWRSNHLLKIETGRYCRSYIPREQRVCELCIVLEGEYHVIFDCIRYRSIRQKYSDLIKVNNTTKLFLNPKVAEIKDTTMFLHDIENVLEKN